MPRAWRFVETLTGTQHTLRRSRYLKSKFALDDIAEHEARVTMGCATGFASRQIQFNESGTLTLLR